MAARGLVGMASILLRMVGLAQRAGYLDLAQIEYCVRISAKLRGGASRLIRPRPAPRRTGPHPSLPRVFEVADSDTRRPGCP
jgi:hypothetical protein